MAGPEGVKEASLKAYAEGFDVCRPELLADPSLLSLIESLLVQAPEERLGVRGTSSDISAITSHAYFHGFEWELLRRGALPAPFNPKDEGVPLRRSRDLPKPHRVPEVPVKGVPLDAAAAFAYVDVPQVEADIVERLASQPDALADILGTPYGRGLSSQGSGSAPASCACTLL